MVYDVYKINNRLFKIVFNQPSAILGCQGGLFNILLYIKIYEFLLLLDGGGSVYKKNFNVRYVNFYTSYNIMFFQEGARL
jgi:hypothetical protein